MIISDILRISGLNALKADQKKRDEEVKTKEAMLRNEQQMLATLRSESSNLKSQLTEQMLKNHNLQTHSKS